MEDDELDNDFLVENFQEEIKDSQIIFKSESGNDEKSPDYNEINDDVFQSSTNKNSPQKEILKYDKNKDMFPIDYSNIKKIKIINITSIIIIVMKIICLKVQITKIII